MSDKRNKSSWLYYVWNAIAMAIFLLLFVPLNVLNGIATRVSLALTLTETRTFTVHIHEDELACVHEWVRTKDGIETGGDLFGLWIDQHTAVVQLVLGPGKNCRRTETSFYQDVDYLKECGEAITKDHGLCNIGQWHSHHRLPLDHPSSGDDQTVWGNMPGLGLNRFIVFIATIKELSRVNVVPFLYEIDSETKEKRPVLRGQLVMCNSLHSPLRCNRNILEKLEQGAETMNNSISSDSTYIDLKYDEKR